MYAQKIDLSTNHSDIITPIPESCFNSRLDALAKMGCATSNSSLSKSPLVKIYKIMQNGSKEQIATALFINQSSSSIFLLSSYEGYILEQKDAADVSGDEFPFMYVFKSDDSNPHKYCFKGIFELAANFNDINAILWKIKNLK